MSNIGVGFKAGYNILGESNIFIGTFADGKLAADTHEIVIGHGTSSTPLLGMGSNTALIDAPSGFYIKNAALTGKFVVEAGNILKYNDYTVLTS